MTTFPNTNLPPIIRLGGSTDVVSFHSSTAADWPLSTFAQPQPLGVRIIQVLPDVIDQPERRQDRRRTAKRRRAPRR
jgi:hypothetical protein